MPHLVHPSILLSSGPTWGDPEQSPEGRDWMPSKGRCVPSQGGDWGPPTEGALRTLLPAVLCQRHPTPSPQSPNCHLSSRTRLLRDILQASYHRTLQGLRVRGDDPNSRLPPLIFWGVLKEGAYLLARRLLRSRIGETIRSQAPNKMLLPPPPPPIDLPLFQASSLPPLCRLGRWPHLSRLPLHRPHAGPSL